MDVVIASSPADADAAAAVESHHAEMAGALALHVERLVAEAARPHEEGVRLAQEALVKWCHDELVPHALAEESAIYPSARALPEGRLLVEGMLGEHQVILRLVRELAATSDPVVAAAGATALKAVFDSHLAKENDLLLPLLVAATEVSVAALLDRMHEQLSSDDHGDGIVDDGCGGHSCGCGETDGPGLPELDARAVPHAIRHATIFGALDAVAPGGGMVLVAPHDPLPLLAQVEQRYPGRFEVAYVERGPEAWRLSFTARASA